MRRRYKKNSIFVSLLAALIPFTEENLLLTFRPGAFFDSLSKQTGASQQSLRSSLTRAIREGYVNRDSGIPVLTKKGRRRLETVPSGELMLDGNYFMVVYDIPQKYDYRRRQLAMELRALGFKQYQKSFWLADRNYTQHLLDLLAELKIGRYVTMGTFARTYGHSLEPDSSAPTE